MIPQDKMPLFMLGAMLSSLGDNRRGQGNNFGQMFNMMMNMKLRQQQEAVEQERWQANRQDTLDWRQQQMQERQADREYRTSRDQMQDERWNKQQEWNQKYREYLMEGERMRREDEVRRRDLELRQREAQQSLGPTARRYQEQQGDEWSNYAQAPVSKEDLQNTYWNSIGGVTQDPSALSGIRSALGYGETGGYRITPIPEMPGFHMMTTTGKDGAPHYQVIRPSDNPYAAFMGGGGGGGAQGQNVFDLAAQQPAPQQPAPQQPAQPAAQPAPPPARPAAEPEPDLGAYRIPMPDTSTVAGQKAQQNLRSQINVAAGKAFQAGSNVTLHLTEGEMRLALQGDIPAWMKQTIIKHLNSKYGNR